MSNRQFWSHVDQNYSQTMLGHSPTTIYPDIFFIAPPKHVVTFFRPPGRYFSTSTCISLRTVTKLWRHVKPSILESRWPKLFTNNARSLPYHDISRHFLYCPPKTCSHIFSTPWQIFQYEYMYKPMHCDQTLTSCQIVGFGVKLPKLFTNNARSLPYNGISTHFFYCPSKTCSHIFSTPWQIFQYEYMYKPMHCDQTLTSCQIVDFGVTLTKTIHKQCSVTPLQRHIHTFLLLPPQNM